MDRTHNATGGRDIVVIGASAGGLSALQALVAGLPSDLAAAVFVVVHMHAEANSVLPIILARSTRIPVAFAKDGDAIAAGRISIAPPGKHLLLRSSGVRVSAGPRENGFRPAVDPLFRTAARAFGPRVIGVVLSGSLDDGAVGAARIKQRDGVVIVQAPHDATVPSMPAAAIRKAPVDEVVPAAAMGPLIARLARTPLPMKAVTEQSDDIDSAEGAPDALRTRKVRGNLVPVTCPECGGSLWELEEHDLVSFRCHVGHRYGEESLVEAIGEKGEQALWVALRALEEQAALSRRMQLLATQKQLSAIAEMHQQKASDAEQRADVLRAVLTGTPSPTIDDS